MNQPQFSTVYDLIDHTDHRHDINNVQNLSETIRHSQSSKVPMPRQLSGEGGCRIFEAAK